jgi:hypothetical protein
VYKDYKEQGFVVLGIDTGGMGGGESEEDVKAFIEQTLCTFPFVWDQMPKTMQQFAFPPAISPYPRQVLIGKDGKVVYLNSEYDQGALRAAIESALAG